ncbi:MAG: Alcohol dehydrogenase zinc-binding domain protein [Verrucomicrobiales bacterium]|nr:Alcohol dehydrogenase zinc-binding domain protein [Verrucomicrobiales bacterium]
MKAAVLHGKEDIRIEEVMEKPLKQGELRLAIQAALTCGTDLKVYKRGYHARMLVPPTVFGHELAGIISETGVGTDHWSVGERVVVANSAPCGHCFYCLTAQENLCDDLLFLNGAYAESIVIPSRMVEKNLYRIKSSTEFSSAALTEPLACVVQGLADLAPKSGERALVIGSGPIGLMFVSLLTSMGCKVAVLGRGAERLQTASELGAESITELRNDSSVESLQTGLGRLDLVIEAVGKPETWELALTLVRKGGKVNFFGGCPAGTQVNFDATRIHYSNIHMMASFHHTPSTFRSALGHIEDGSVPAAKFITQQRKLDELPFLFEEMAKGSRAVKTLIVP